jgi:hypothetical protein
LNPTFSYQSGLDCRGDPVLSCWICTCFQSGSSQVTHVSSQVTHLSKSSFQSSDTCFLSGDTCLLHADISSESIAAAKDRYHSDKMMAGASRRPPFDADFYVADCTKVQSVCVYCVGVSCTMVRVYCVRVSCTMLSVY